MLAQLTRMAQGQTPFITRNRGVISKGVDGDESRVAEMMQLVGRCGKSDMGVALLVVVGMV
jgi:hypothetical protein